MEYKKNTNNISPRKSALISACVCFYFISMGLLSAFSVNAQTNNQIQLMISPEILELQLEKGEVYNGKIKIYNKGEAPMPLEAIASNFDAEELSGIAVFYDNLSIANENEEKDDILFNPRKWMKIDNPNFILDSDETVNVKFSISVPENAENGGYYTVIFFDPKVSSSGNVNQEKNNVNIVTKVGTPLLITIGEREKSIDAKILTISEFSIPERFHLKKLENSIISLTGLFSTAYAETIKTFSVVETGRLQFELIVKNNDIYHNKPYGKLAILSSGGKSIGETEIRKTTILPGRSRKIPVEFEPEIPTIIKKLPAPLSNFISKNLFFGKFYAELALNAEDKMTTEKIEFWIFPWKTAIWIFVVLASILILRKRIAMSLKALVKKTS